MAAVAPLPGAGAAKLRVGVFADAALQPRWIVEALARVAAADFAEVVATVVVPPGRRAREPLSLRAYRRLDRWWFGSEPSEPVLLAEHVEGFDFQSLLDLQLDVAFAVGDFDDTVLDGLARHGVWRLRVDGLGEVAAGEPLTTSLLSVRLARGAPEREACRSWSRTYPLSAARNRAGVLEKTGAFAWRALRELHRSGRGWLEQRPVFRGIPAGGNRALTPIFKRIVGRGIEKALHVEQWSLAFRFGNGPGDARAVPANLEGFTRIPQPRDRDWADPFALEKNGRYFVFFEELPYALGKAHISMMEIDREGRCSAPVRVLERDYHLSYPQLLEHDGELYMVPESAKNRTVELYRCIDFPLRWRLERRLLEGVRCVDATLHCSGERWWLFANAAVGESRGYDDELHLFHSPSLAGDWQPHPRNPVKSDARGARPAGALYWREGALYRPAQICVPRYGAGIALNRVLRLTPRDYAERQVKRILPGHGDGLFGIHTVNRAGYLTVVDAFIRRRRI